MSRRPLSDRVRRPRRSRDARNRVIFPLGALIPLLFAALTLALPSAGASQTPDPGASLRIPSYSEVSVSSRGATILLEFEGRPAARFSLENGAIRIDGDDVGRYTPGGPLDQSWRALLSEAVSAQNGRLATLLLGWTPPAGLSAESRSGAEALRTRLGALLRTAPAPGAGGGAGGGAPGAMGSPTAGLTLDAATERSLLDFIVANPGRAEVLSALLAGRDPVRASGPLELRIGVPVEVTRGDRLAASLLVVDADARIEGTLDGDLLVLGGTIRLGEGGSITGDARWIDGGLIGSTARIGGEARDLGAVEGSGIDSGTPSTRDGFRDLRNELTEIREEIRRSAQPRTGSSSSTRGRWPFFRNFLSGVGSLLQTVMTFALLLGMGIVALRFFPRRLEIVARTAAHSSGRAFLVGGAGILLSPFAYLSGFVILVVTIIGIPFALLWVVAFPLAFAVALLLGYLGAARTLGAWWVARSDTYVPERLDPTRPLAHLGIGLVLLLVGYAVAALFQMGGGWFALFRGLAFAIALLAGGSAMALGLGAVLLSRGGQRTEWAGDVSDLAGGDFTGGTSDSGPDFSDLEDLSDLHDLSDRSRLEDFPGEGPGEGSGEGPDVGGPADPHGRAPS
jgi:hypothetical protein